MSFKSPSGSMTSISLRDEFGVTVSHYELSDNARFNEVCRSLPVR